MLALAAATDRALAKAENVSNRGCYFDLLLIGKTRVKDPPMTGGAYLALDRQLDRILAEGLTPASPATRHAGGEEWAMGMHGAAGKPQYRPRPW